MAKKLKLKIVARSKQNRTTVFAIVVSQRKTTHTVDTGRRRVWSSWDCIYYDACWDLRTDSRQFKRVLCNGKRTLKDARENFCFCSWPHDGAAGG